MLSVFFWKQAWVWFKNYWYWPVIIVLLLTTVVAGSGLRDKFFDLLFKQRESYEKELEILKREQATKEKKVEEVTKNYSEELKLIEREHKIKVDDLEEEKQQELIQMVKENKNKPDKLAAELARILSAEHYRNNR
jgi:gas vesicle protein